MSAPAPVPLRPATHSTLFRPLPPDSPWQTLLSTAAPPSPGPTASTPSTPSTASIPSPRTPPEPSPLSAPISARPFTPPPRPRFSLTRAVRRLLARPHRPSARVPLPAPVPKHLAAISDPDSDPDPDPLLLPPLCHSDMHLSLHAPAARDYASFSSASPSHAPPAAAVSVSVSARRQRQRPHIHNDHVHVLDHTPPPPRWRPRYPRRRSLDDRVAAAAASASRHRFPDGLADGSRAYAPSSRSLDDPALRPTRSAAARRPRRMRGGPSVAWAVQTDAAHDRVEASASAGDGGARTWRRKWIGRGAVDRRARAGEGKLGLESGRLVDDVVGVGGSWSSVTHSASLSSSFNYAA